MTMENYSCLSFSFHQFLFVQGQLIVNYNSPCAQNDALKDDAELLVIRNPEKELKELKNKVQALEDKTLKITENLDRFGLKNYKYPDGWELVFRARAGNGMNVLSSWRGGDTICLEASGCFQDTISPYNLAMDPQRTHIRSRIIDMWNSSNINEVKFSLYKGDAEVVFLTFNASGSDNENWMDVSRLLRSSYRDTPKSGTYNVFSMQGPINGDRTFYVNKHWRGCPNDFGWFFVSERYHRCNFDSFPSYPQFLYAPNNQGTRFAALEFALADFLMIFIKRN